MFVCHLFESFCRNLKCAIVPELKMEKITHMLTFFSPEEQDHLESIFVGRTASM
jgi:hypothetical protein